MTKSQFFIKYEQKAYDVAAGDRDLLTELLEEWYDDYTLEHI